MLGLSYEYDVNKLWLGGSYGNIEIFTRTDARSNLGGLWCAEDDQFYVGRMVMNVAVDGERLEARTTTFNPVSQMTTYEGHDLSVQKTFFVPYGLDDLRRVFQVARLRNFQPQERAVEITLSVQYPQFAWPEFSKLPDMTQKNKRVSSEVRDGLVITTTQGRESEARVLGAAIDLVDSRLDARTAELTYRVTLGAHEEREVPFILVISNRGVDDAVVRYRESAAEEPRAVLTLTEQQFGRVLNMSDILTPDPVITRAIRWAKINTLREQRAYPIGNCFTNDPPQDILVVRDIAWFSVGSDYMTPDFSRGAMELVRDYGVEPGGEITEYIMACEDPPFKSNYNLNINDDTPLFIFAVHHHYALTADEEFLRGMWPTVRGAADWILQQKRAGLIWCTSEEANVWGIVSWRNIIPEYQISGAVTEINAECYMALRLAGRCAEMVGEFEESERFLREALELKENINKQLVSEQTGLYLLNIDYGGKKHHNVTGDLVFPVMFGIADEEMRERILDRLYAEDSWTPFGVRTVPKNEPEYDPEYGVRLIGGIWPNLTGWVAYANRIDHPERMIEGMRNIFRISEVDNPLAYKNVVPGQYAECLHGDTYQSRGMALSPWMPATFIWLAIDGLLGFRPQVTELSVQPHLPESWQWLAIKDVPYRGRRFSLFYHRGTIYSSQQVDTGYPLELFDEDVSSLVETNAYVIALRRKSELVVFVGVPERQGVTLSLKAPLVEEEQRYEFLMNPGDSQVITVSIPDTVPSPLPLPDDSWSGALDDSSSTVGVGSSTVGADGHRATAKTRRATGQAHRRTSAPSPPAEVVDAVTDSPLDHDEAESVVVPPSRTRATNPAEREGRKA